MTLFEDLNIATKKLPATNGLRLWLDEGIRIIIRPSGTEPKMKCYIEVVRPGGSDVDKADADGIVASLKGELLALLS